MIVWSGGLYTLDSAYNGAAYTLTAEGTPPRSVFIQGDDATQFRDEWEALERQHPDWHGDQVFGWLWDQCGYGDVAQPPEVIVTRGNAGPKERLGFRDYKGGPDCNS